MADSSQLILWLILGTEHWNYFTNDEDLGPVILSLKQETINGRDQFRYLCALY